MPALLPEVHHLSYAMRLENFPVFMPFDPKTAPAFLMIPALGMIRSMPHLDDDMLFRRRPFDHGSHSSDLPIARNADRASSLNDFHKAQVPSPLQNMHLSLIVSFAAARHMALATSSTFPMEMLDGLLFGLDHLPEHDLVGIPLFYQTFPRFPALGLHTLLVQCQGADGVG